jgi:hypothetical protein
LRTREEATQGRKQDKESNTLENQGGSNKESNTLENHHTLENQGGSNKESNKLENQRGSSTKKATHLRTNT